MKRSWESVICRRIAVTLTSGKPGCSVQLAAISATGLPEAPERVPEISGGRVGKLMTRDVSADAVAEFLFAEETFDMRMNDCPFW